MPSPRRPTTTASSVRVTRKALVAVAGNQYSVPVQHVGATVGVRVHADRVVIWRNTEKLAEHQRAHDGAHRRVVDPAHFAPLFERKPRAPVMRYRQALCDLGEVAHAYVSERSRRQRTHLATEVLGIYALFEKYGAADLLSAMELATHANASGVTSLQALLASPTPSVPPMVSPSAGLLLPGVPDQRAVERELVLSEAFVQVSASATEVFACAEWQRC